MMSGWDDFPVVSDQPATGQQGGVAPVAETDDQWSGFTAVADPSVPPEIGRALHQRPDLAGEIWSDFTASRTAADNTRRLGAEGFDAPDAQQVAPLPELLSDAANDAGMQPGSAEFNRQRFTGVDLFDSPPTQLGEHPAPTARPGAPDPIAKPTITPEFWEDMTQTLDRIAPRYDPARVHKESEREQAERRARQVLEGAVRGEGTDISAWHPDTLGRAKEAWSLINATGDKFEKLSEGKETPATQFLRNFDAGRATKFKKADKQMMDWARGGPATADPMELAGLQINEQGLVEAAPGFGPEDLLRLNSAPLSKEQKQLQEVQNNFEWFLYGGRPEVGEHPPRLPAPLQNYLDAFREEKEGTPEWELSKALWQVRNSPKERKSFEHDIHQQTVMRRFLPVLGDLPEMFESTGAAAASQRIAKGKPWDGDYKTVARFLAKTELMGAKWEEKDWLEKGEEILKDMPAWMAGFMATGPVSRAAIGGIKKAALEAAKANIKRGVAKKAATGAIHTAGVMGEAAVRTPLIAPFKSQTDAATFQIDAGTHNLLSSDKPPKDSSWIGNIPAGVTKQYIEVLSETIGGRLMKGIGVVASKTGVKAAVKSIPYAQKMGVTLSAIRGKMTSKGLKGAGFHGMPEEFLEERAGELMEGSLGKLFDYYAERDFDFGSMGMIAKNDPRGWEQLKAEVFAFGLMGGGHAAVSSARGVVETQMTPPQEKLMQFLSHSSQKNYDRLPADLKVLSDAENTARGRQEYAGRLRGAVDAVGKWQARARDAMQQTLGQEQVPETAQAEYGASGESFAQPQFQQQPVAQAPVQQAPAPAVQPQQQARQQPMQRPQPAAEFDIENLTDPQAVADYLELPGDVPLPKLRDRELGGFILTVPQERVNEVVQLARAKGFANNTSNTVNVDGQARVQLGFRVPDVPQDARRDRQTPAVAPQAPAVAPSAPVAPQPEAVRVGGQQRIGGVDSTVADVQVVDGVRYELYRHNADRGGALRVFDVDSGEVVTIKRYPTFKAAERDHNNAVRASQPADAPAAPQQVEQPPVEQPVDRLRRDAERVLLLSDRIAGLPAGPELDSAINARNKLVKKHGNSIKSVVQELRRERRQADIEERKARKAARKTPEHKATIARGRIRKEVASLNRRGVTSAPKRKIGLKPIGPATWNTAEGVDQPVVISHVAGIDDAGKVFLAIEGSSTSIPLDQVSFEGDPKPEAPVTRGTETGRRIGQITEQEAAPKYDESGRLQSKPVAELARPETAKDEAPVSDIDAAMQAGFEEAMGLAFDKPTKAAPKPKRTRAKKQTARSEKPRTQKAKQALDKARDEFKDAFGIGRGTTLMMGAPLDPAKIKATVNLTKAAVNYGIVKFQDYIEYVVAEIGADVAESAADYFESAWRVLKKSREYSHVDDAGSVAEALQSLKEQADEGSDLGSGVEPSGGGAARVAGEPVEDREAGGVSGREGVRGSQPDGETAGAAPEHERGGDQGAGVAGDSGPAEPGRGLQQGATGTRRAKAGSVPRKAPVVHLNHVIRPGDSIVPKGGPKARAKANISAIKLLKRLEKESRDATPAEKKVLAQYVGWGALSNAFHKGKGEAYVNDLPLYRKQYLYRTKQDETRQPSADELQARIKRWEDVWGEVYRDLKEALTDREFNAAAESTLNAHYTERSVIDQMWSMVERLGFKGGKVLEPSAGVGHFFGLMPSEIAENSETIGIELDSLTGRILKKLYPETNVFVKGFEEVPVPNNSIDLAISNVPFARTGPNDAVKRYGREMNLHNYFIARMIDSVKPGGLVVAISTHFSLDSNRQVRELFAQNADMVGAIRLPNNAFKANAGTEVTTDIIILRKRDATPYRGESWVGVGKVGEHEVTKPPESKGKKPVTVVEPIFVNEYFAAHPEMVLGTHSMAGEMYGPGSEYTVQPKPGDLSQQIQDAIEKLPVNVFGDAAAEQVDFEELGEAGDIKDYTLVMRNGNLAFVLGRKFTSPDYITQHIKRGGAAAKQRALEQAKDYIGLRDHYDSHLKLMLSPESTDAQIERSMEKLNEIYDAYREKHGALADKKSHFLSQDSGYWRSVGMENILERTDPKTGKIVFTYQKHDVFRKRTIAPTAEPTTAETTTDALYHSLAWKGGIDTPYMANILDIEEGALKNKLVNEGLAFENPESGLFETRTKYLSGDVRKKLEQATEAAKSNKKLKRNVDALKEIQPAPVSISNINFQPAGTWIPQDLMEGFAREVFNSRDGRVAYSEQLDKWFVHSGSFNSNPQTTEKFGTSRMDGPAILEKMLNLGTIEIRDTHILADGSKTSKPNLKETTAAQQKAEQLKKEFRRWIGHKEDRQTRLQEAYNEAFNFYVDPVYDGSHLTLPGSSDSVKLRPYQKNAVWRLLQDGFGMLAHTVGAGKTYTMIAAAMEMKRLGLANKPLLVVQNSTLLQFAASFQQFYPTANVLVATKDDLSTERRRAFLSRLAAGDYDAVVVAHSTFNRKLPNDQAREEAMVQDMVSELETYLFITQAEEGKSGPTVKEVQKQIKVLRKRLEEIQAKLKEQQDDDITFEEMGIDALFLDEAHAYKKTPFNTKISGKIKGIQKSMSQQAMSALLKMRFIQEKNRNRNVFLATGTPITNTLGELWNMHHLVAPHVLKDFGVDTFDRFASTFAEITPELEMNYGGKWVPRATMSRFVNGFQLGQLIRAAWDVLDRDTLNDHLKQLNELDEDGNLKGLPRLKGGKPTTVTVPLSASVAGFKKFLSEVFKTYEALPGKDKRRFSYIPVLTYNAAKAAALDVRLVYPEAKDDTGSKVNTAAKHVHRIWEETKGKKSTQLIFSDSANYVNMEKLVGFVGGSAVEIDIETDEAEDGGAGDVGQFLYRDMVKKLVALGIPEKEIAIINDFKTDAKKKQLFDAVNAGNIRVVIGHSETLGTGVNVQTKLKAIHHLDAPWYPALLEQRQGRMIRFGNENAEVEEYNYGMKDTLDAAIYGKLARKSKFIWQAISGKLGAEFDDPASSEILTAEEQMAALSGDPLAMEMVTLGNRMRSLRYEREAWEDSKARARDGINEHKRRLESSKARLDELESAVAKLDTLIGDSPEWSATINDTAVEGRKAVVEALDKAIKLKAAETLEATKKDRMVSWKGIAQSGRFHEHRAVSADINGIALSVYVGANATAATNEKGNLTTKWNEVIESEFFLGDTWVDGGHGIRTGEGIMRVVADLPARAERSVVKERDEIKRFEEELIELRGILDSKFENDQELIDAEKRMTYIKGRLEKGAQTVTNQTKYTLLGEILSEAVGEKTTIDPQSLRPVTESGGAIPDATIRKAEDDADREVLRLVRENQVAYDEVYFFRPTTGIAVRPGEARPTRRPRGGSKAIEAALTEADVENLAGEPDVRGSLLGGMGRLERERADVVPDVIKADNPEVERRIQESRGQVPDSFADKLAEAVEWIKGGFRARRHIPNIPKFGAVGEFFRLLPDVPKKSSDKANRYIAAILNEAGPKQLKVLERKLIYENQLAAAELGQPLRFGFKSVDEVKAELKKIDALLKTDELKPVRKALERRESIRREIVGHMIEHGRLSQEDLENDRYFHQQVLSLLNERRHAQRKGIGPKKRGFEKARSVKDLEAEEFDYNTSYIEAEATWMTQALVEIEKERLIETLPDVLPQLKAKAKTLNFERAVGGLTRGPKVVKRIEELRLLIRDSRESDGSRKQREAWGEELEKLDPTYPMRKQMAKASAMLERDGIKTTGDGFFPELNKLAKAPEGTPGKIAALMMLKALADRDKAIVAAIRKRALKVLTYRDLMDDSQATWAARPGTIFYRAFTVPERIAEQLQAGIIEKAELTKDQLHEVLASAGQRDPMVLPKEVVAELESIEQKPPTSYNLYQDAHRGWKVWTLHQPKRALAYTVRNFTGDVDPVIGGLPGALKHIPKATSELRAYYYGKKLAASKHLQDAVDYSVLDASMTASEIPDLKELPIFRRFYEQKADPRKLPKGYFATVKKFNEFREAILRYSAYLEYLAQIKAGTLKHYGGSRKGVVDAIRRDLGDEAAAAHLSRNLLGDYGNISVLGQWLRKNLVPFWSFQEINLKRYPRLFINAVTAGDKKAAAGTVAAASVKGAVGATILTMRLAAMYSLYYAWNLLLFGDDEEELSPHDRANPHINLGRNPDGSIRVFRNPGAFGDFLEWFGGNDALSLWQQYFDGQIKGEDIVIEVAKAPVEKFVHGTGPQVQTTLELVGGVSLFPDVFNPRSIDRSESVAAAVGMRDEMRMLRGWMFDDGTKMRPYYFQRTMLGVSDPKRNALHEMHDARERFLKQKGEQTRTGFGSSPAKPMREAAMNGDYEAFLEARKGYLKSGKTFDNFWRSAASLDPIASKLKKEDEIEFEQKFLNGVQRKRLRVAREYSQDLRLQMWQWWKAAEDGYTGEQAEQLQRSLYAASGPATTENTDEQAERAKEFVQSIDLDQNEAESRLEKYIHEQQLKRELDNLNKQRRQRGMGPVNELPRKPLLNRTPEVTARLRRLREMFH